MWDDSLGAGLQMALFDAVGKTLGTPAYRLLGTKVREFCPLSWWAMDMPPADWARLLGRQFERFFAVDEDEADDAQRLRDAIEGWAEAWSSQDAEAYLSHYCSTFLPADGSDREAWAESRRRRLARPTLRFLAGETSIELIVLSDQSASDPPRDPISGGALDMRGIDELRTLIDAETS